MNMTIPRIKTSSIDLPNTDMGYSSEIAVTKKNAKDKEMVNILLVEDNRVNRLIIGRMIEHLGYDIFYAENGQIAVDLCQEKVFSLILMDCQMPVMDGLTATTIIRTSTLNCNVPIVAVTANAMTSDREACLQVGMNEHLAKPVKLDDLSAIVKHWLH